MIKFLSYIKNQYKRYLESRLEVVQKGDYRRAIKYLRSYASPYQILKLSQSDCFVLKLLSRYELATYYLKELASVRFLNPTHKNTLTFALLLGIPIKEKLTTKNIILRDIIQLFNQDMKRWLDENNILPYDCLKVKNQEARRHAKLIVEVCITMQYKGFRPITDSNLEVNII